MSNEQNRKPVSNINKVLLNGRLTQNCNYRAAQADAQGNVTKQSVAYFTVACNEGWLRNDGSEAVSYISCQINGKYADVMANHLLQGVGVVVEGRLRTWSDKTPTGQYENKYMVVVDNVNLTSRPQSQAPMPPAQNQGQMPNNQPVNPVQNQAPVQGYQQDAGMAGQPAYAPAYAPNPVQNQGQMQQAANPYQAPNPPVAPAPVPNAPAQAAPQTPVYTQANNPFAQAAPAPNAPVQNAAPAQQFAYSNNPFEIGGVGNSANFA